MQTTSIAWATYSVGFVTGCTHAGPECDLCYAEVFTKRQANQESGPDYAVDFDWDGEHEEEVVVVHDGTPTLVDEENDEWIAVADRRKEPYNYHFPDGPGRIFVVSMGDLFHRQVYPQFIFDVVDVARDFPEHIWVFLTKRPGRAAELGIDWPDNAWVGASVGTGPGGEYPDMTHRIDQLKQVDASTRWISAEPLIEPLGEIDLDGIDWLVVGGETAAADVRRDMDHDWARDLYRQAREQDTAFFFKQSSHRYPERGRHLAVPDDDSGMMVQRKFEEYPDLPEVTVDARSG